MNARRGWTVWMAALALLAGLWPAAATHRKVSYQGYVLDAGGAFTGLGHFKFALVTSVNLNQTAEAYANPPSGGFITIINLYSGGSGYTNAPAVTISGGGGSGATATASISGGVVTSITVNNPGSGYTSTPYVTVASPPANISYTTYWSNDETSTNGSEPATGVAIDITNGLFRVLLGNTALSNMAALDSSIFQQAGLQLRIWFDGGSGYAVLEPPQDATTMAYAVTADYVLNASASAVADNPVFTGTVFADAFCDTNGSFLSGVNNSIGAGSQFDKMGGGNFNLIGTNTYAVIIDGGEENNIGADCSYAAIEGGYYNSIGTNYSWSATIVGGQQNTIGANDPDVFIGGGEYNQIAGPQSWYTYFPSTIGGGFNNGIGSNTVAVIVGGSDNVIGNGSGIDMVGAVILGGYENTIGNHAGGAVIAGGFANHIGDGEVGGYYFGSTILGGSGNSVGTNALENFIGGGVGNKIGNGSYASAMVDGYENSIGSNVSYSVLGGGGGSVIQSNISYATIPGGADNIAGGNSGAFAAGSDARAANDSSFVWGDGSAPTSSSSQQTVTFRASGGYRFFTGNGAFGAKLAAGATAWSILCDRNVKKNFRPVNTVAVLNKLAALPIEQWNYQWEKDSDVPNIGPMAQDFKAAFYPGRDDKTITTLEFDGVELAAIQGLNEKLEQGTQKAETQMEQLGAQAAALKSRVEKLEALVKVKKGN